jgi:hypothetical protein
MAIDTYIAQVLNKISLLKTAKVSSFVVRMGMLLNLLNKQESTW